MIGKKAIAIMWMFFFIIIVSLSATYVYFVKYKFNPEERVIGSLQIEMNELVNKGDILKFNTEKASVISANKGLKNLFMNGGVLMKCETVDGYNILFSREECYLNKDILFNNFIEKFWDNFGNYLKLLEVNIHKFDYNYNISNDIFKGITNQRIELVKENISYSIKPNFFVELEYNPLQFINLLKEIASKEECLKKIEFNELSDSEDKIAKECNFYGEYEWKIKKKNDYLFFDIKTMREIKFVGKIDFRFAIYLNSLKLIKESLEGMNLNVVNL